MRRWAQCRLCFWQDRGAREAAAPGRMGLSGERGALGTLHHAHNLLQCCSTHPFPTLLHFWEFRLRYRANPTRHPMQDALLPGAGPPPQTPLQGGGPCPSLAESSGGAAGVPVRQRMLGGTEPGAGAGPRESHIVQRCRQPGGCSQPGVSWRDSPNHPGLWRGPPSLGEGEDKAARTHTHSFPPSSISAPVSLLNPCAVETLALLGTLHCAAHHRGPTEPLPAPPQHPARTRSGFASSCREVAVAAGLQSCEPKSITAW